MPYGEIAFSQLRSFLVDLGFRVVEVPDSHIWLDHPGGAEIALPIYADDENVRPHHIQTVGIMLDGFGVMDRDEFDRRMIREEFQVAGT